MKGMGEVRAPQWTLRTLIAVVVIVAVLVCVAVPGLRDSQRASNEVAASSAMGSLYRADEDFRENDRDNDGAQNYWVGDVYGLFALTPASAGTLQPPDPARMIRLIEPRLAAADVTACGNWPGAVAVQDAVGRWAPRSGYVFFAFARYETTAGSEPFGESGRIAARGRGLNATRFALCAMPLNYSQGHQMFIAYSEFGIRRGDPGSSYDGIYRRGGQRATFQWTGAKVGGTPFTPEVPFPRSPGGAGWSSFD